MSVSEQRKHATQAAAVGGSMVGSAMLANHGLDRMLERKGVKPPVRALLKRKPSKWHVPYAAGKLATRSVQAVGVPLAAYGAFNLVSPADKVARVRLKDDVARPVVRQATGAAQADKVKARIRANRSTRRRTLAQTAQEQDVAKATLTRDESERLSRHKQAGRYLSLASGTMGLTALGLRAPGAARVASRVKPVGKLKMVRRVAAKEPEATRTSNTLGIAAIGTGSVGSFNYAAQQKLERKQVDKALHVAPGYVLNPNWDKHMGSYGSRKLMERLAKEPAPKPRKKPAVPVKKRDDRFLRGNRDRISTDAERGYEYLRRGRNEARGWSALTGVGAGAGAYSAASALRRGGKGGVAGAALFGGLTVLNADESIAQGKKAHRWNNHMKKIKARAYQRAEAGEYGRDRVVTKARISVDKALIPIRPPRIPLAARKPALRMGHIGTSVTGRKFSVRGSVR